MVDTVNKRFSISLAVQGLAIASEGVPHSDNGEELVGASLLGDDWAVCEIPQQGTVVSNDRHGPALGQTVTRCHFRAKILNPVIEVEDR